MNQETLIQELAPAWIRYDIKHFLVLCSPQFTYLWVKRMELNDFKSCLRSAILWIYPVHQGHKWLRAMSREAQRDGWKWPRKKNFGWGLTQKWVWEYWKERKGNKRKDWLTSTFLDWVRQGAVDKKHQIRQKWLWWSTNLRGENE